MVSYGFTSHRGVMVIRDHRDDALLARDRDAAPLRAEERGTKRRKSWKRAATRRSRSRMMMRISTPMPSGARDAPCACALELTRAVRRSDDEAEVVESCAAKSRA